MPLSRLDLPRIVEAIRELYRTVEHPPAANWQAPDWLVAQYEREISLGDVAVPTPKPIHGYLISAAAAEVQYRIKPRGWLLPLLQHRERDCPEITNSSLDHQHKIALLELWVRLQDRTVVNGELARNHSEAMLFLDFLDSVLGRLSGGPSKEITSETPTKRGRELDQPAGPYCKDSRTMSDDAALLNTAERLLTLWASLAPRRQELRSSLERDAGNRSLAHTYSPQSANEQQWLAELKARLLSEEEVHEIQNQLTALQDAEALVQEIADRLAITLKSRGADTRAWHRLVMTLDPQYVPDVLLAIREARAQLALDEGADRSADPGRRGQASAEEQGEGVGESDGGTATGQGEAASMGDQDEEPPKALSPLQYDILDALRALKVIDAEKRATGQKIADRVGGSVTEQSVKAPLADLKRRKLVDSTRGRHGGSWLTPKGLDLINTLRPKQ